MMLRIWNAQKMSVGSPLAASAACLVGALVQIAPVAAQNSSGWGTRMESEAEFAYRSVYQRSLAAGAGRAAGRSAGNTTGANAPAARAAPARPAQAELRQPAAAGPPDLPVRNPLAADTRATYAQAAEPAITQPLPPQPRDPQTVAATPVEVPQPKPDADDSVAMAAPRSDPWSEPLFARAGDRDDLLVTGVLGSDDQGEVRDRAPRDRGDQYCSSIATAATDARFAWQRQTLRETEEQLKKRIEELQAQIADYKKWLARRDEFSQRAQSAVTDIYSKMAPDAAAQQLTVLDEETAAAVLAQLKPQVASAVMAEMDANRAARLTAIISASSKGPKGKPPVSPRGQGT